MGDPLSDLGVALAGRYRVERELVGDPTRPWHRCGFRVRAGRMFFTLGDRESDVLVVDLGRQRTW